MKALRTLIVDDEPLAIERMEALCAQIPALNIIGSAQNGVEALAMIEAQSPDLLLLDITMPQMDGRSLAKALEGVAARPMVIFITAHDHFALEAFDLDAVDYVLKPVSLARLERAAARALARAEERGKNGVPAASSPYERELWVPHRSDLIRLDIARIHRIDAERDYVRLFVDPSEEEAGIRSYLLLQTIAKMEERLDPEQFIRIHRSTILRRDYIRSLCHEGMGVWSVEAGDGSVLRIGRTHLAKVKQMAGK